jgi:hypothetical protein
VFHVGYDDRQHRIAWQREALGRCPRPRSLSAGALPVNVKATSHKTHRYLPYKASAASGRSPALPWLAVITSSPQVLKIIPLLNVFSYWGHIERALDDF